MASVAEESKAISPSVQPGQMQHAHKHPTGLLEPGKKLGTMSSSWRPSSLGMGQSKAGLALPHLHKCAWWVIFGKAAATGITWWLLIRPHRLVTASADAGLASSTLLSKNQKSRCKCAIKHGTFMWCEQDEQHQRMERESELN
ncbi:uncharacterized protein [Triticum aestivum]|uniref:uncharacterized protein n=1 Tax=Triticum aestivum TaxID=4565 RepID=UPI001D034922|nr:uncharacterized protein LOC123111999 [Triticum aestivum]